MHEKSFPDSPETPDQRSARALEALHYEERAGLGFRRRGRSPIGDPYLEPERYQIDRHQTSSDLWAGYLAGLGAVIGFGALFYKPLMLGSVAVVLVILGSLSDGPARRVAGIGLVVTGVCVFLGMLLAIFVTKTAIW